MKQEDDNPLLLITSFSCNKSVSDDLEKEGLISHRLINNAHSTENADERISRLFVVHNHITPARLTFQ